MAEPAHPRDRGGAEGLFGSGDRPRLPPNPNQMEINFSDPLPEPQIGAPEFPGFSFLKKENEIASRAERPTLKRFDLASLSGVEHYSNEAIRALSKFFDRSITPEDRPKLAAELVFPSSRFAAELFAQRLSGKLSPEEERTLQAYARSPENQKAVEYHRIKLLGERDLSPLEIADLYALERFPHDRRGALMLRDTIIKEIMPIQAGQLSKPEVQAALLSFVRSELRIPDNKLLSSKELSTLFCMSEAEIRTALQSGLTAQEKAAREERRILAEASEKFALEQAIRKGVRDLISIENGLHQMGRISRLSTTQEIGELFGLSGVPLRKAVKLIQSEELKYRAETLEKSVGQMRVDNLVRSVVTEIDSFRRGEIKSLKSDEDWGRDISVSPVAVFRYLRDGVPTEMKHVRELHLLEAGTPSFRSSPQAFVRAELAAFDAGEIRSLSSNEDIGKMFNVSAGAVADLLRQRGTGLTPSELKFRSYIFSHQAPRTVVEQSLREVSMSLLLERIERANRGRRDERANDHSEERNPLLYRIKGKRFDSLEEAAAGLMMERYIPGFQLVEGKTMQIRTSGARFDFLHDNTIIEYHPERLAYKIKGSRGLESGSFGSQEEYEAFLAVKDSLRERAKKLYVKEVLQQLSLDYRAERRRAKDADPRLKNMGLIVAASPEEFYYSVINRFSDNAPSRERFLNEFRRMVADLREQLKKN